jgi:hypothetical protein
MKITSRGKKEEIIDIRGDDAETLQLNVRSSFYILFVTPYQIVPFIFGQSTIARR